MEIESTRIFVKVVQQGSFSKAAHVLSIPVSTVSRTIRRMEENIGTKLILRTTRSFTLTQAGRNFYERTVSSVLAIEDAQKSIQGNDDSLKGHIKITSTEDHGAAFVTPVVARLMRLYPGLSFELYYSREVVDLVKGGYDLALRLGKLNPSRFKTIRLGEQALIVVASPEYLSAREKIREPADLVDHTVFVLGPVSGQNKWAFHSRKKKISVALKVSSNASQMQTLVALAEAGNGIALVPGFICKRQMNEGRLIRVLPDWVSSSYQISLVSPNPSGMSARIKMVANAIADEVKEGLS